MHMDTVNGIIDGDIGHLNLTSGSSLFAMTAYRTEPTCAHYSLMDSYSEIQHTKKVRSLEIGCRPEDPLDHYPLLYPP